MSKAAFTVLGSSAGMPQAGRVNSGYVLEVDRRLFPFDCGGGVGHMFRRIGFDPLAVERIVISHTHPDHISDLPLFIQMEYLAGRREPLVVHLPHEAVDPVHSLFRSMYLIREKLPFELSLAPISIGEAIEAEGVKIEPIANSHLVKYAPFISEYGLKSRQESYSYLIRVGSKSLLYSADLGTEGDILGYLDGLDVLVIESTHIDLGRVLEKAAERGVGRVVLTHLAEDYDVSQALAMGQKAGMANLLIAHDGLRIEL